MKICEVCKSLTWHVSLVDIFHPFARAIPGSESSESGSPRDIPGLHHLTSMRPPSSSCVTAAEARDRVHCTALQATAYFAHRELEGTLEHFRAC